MSKRKVGGYSWGKNFDDLRRSLQAIASQAERIFNTANGNDRAAVISFEVLRAHRALDELERIANDGTDNG